MSDSTNTLPKVSVVMPCYNSLKYLRLAIDSVLGQDYPNIELIVVDDGSTDGSIAELESYGDKIVLFKQKNKGPAAARNLGLLHATGQYIAFNDSDDLWLPGKLTKQVSFLEEHLEFIACFTKWGVWDGTSQPSYQPVQPEVKTSFENDKTGWLYLKLLKESIIHTISILIRSDVVKKVGLFNESYKVGEDHDYWIRLSRMGQIAHLNEVCALYRDNLESTTKKLHEKNYSAIILQSSFENFGLSMPNGVTLPYSTYLDYLALRNFNYGYRRFWAGNRSEAKKSFYTCLKLKRLLVKSFIYIVICHIPSLYRVLVNTRNS